MDVPFRVTDATLDVIEVLLAGQPDLYALKISKEIGRPSGSVVPILMRLEDCGWVTSKWEDSGSQSRGPRRRFYELDPNRVAGARSLVVSRRQPATRCTGIVRPGLAGGC
ncbi:helix-turn-helix transcriptional regulator [Streptomyces erythrochromogenes]|uniref:helix-turn-helix transcriptional regulator n=1 Tax=Streptomyces erythrochromogenes TaxID=285574 RepID=UPI00342560FC